MLNRRQVVSVRMAGIMKEVINRGGGWYPGERKTSVKKRSNQERRTNMVR